MFVWLFICWWAVDWVREWHNCRRCFASLLECDSFVSTNWLRRRQSLLLCTWSRRTIQRTSDTKLAHREEEKWYTLFLLWRNSPNRSSAALSLRFLYHTHTRARGRTPLKEWSAGHRGRYIHNTQQTQGTKNSALSKNLTLGSSNQGTAELRLDHMAIGISEDWCILGLFEDSCDCYWLIWTCVCKLRLVARFKLFQHVIEVAEESHRRTRDGRF